LGAPLPDRFAQQRAADLPAADLLPRWLLDPLPLVRVKVKVRVSLSLWFLERFAMMNLTSSKN